MKAVAPGQLRQLRQRHSILHRLLCRAVQNFLRVPPPDTLPRYVRIDLQRIENHGQAGRAAVSRIHLRRELFRQLEIVFHGALHERLSEELFALLGRK